MNDRPIKNDPVLGPAFPEFGWVPAPRYLMRRNRILALTEHMPPGQLLEIGPGAGTLLVEFTRRGFRCEALESSIDARTTMQQVLNAAGVDVDVHAVPGDDWNGRFDCVFAFDVLEHIEDDRAALAQWKTWLRKGGTLVLSVPAHMTSWNASDEWAGHYRRYDKDDLIALVQSMDLQVEQFECYGFPVANLTERLSVPMYRRAILRRNDSAAPDQQANNDRSGIDRRAHMHVFRLMDSWAGRTMLRVMYRVQSWFLRTDLGSAYVLLARAE
jgi:SAM-dependent methyltransferase